MSRIISLLGLLLSLPASSNETIIESSVLKQNDNNTSYFVEKSDTQGPSESAMLFHIPGLTLTEHSGPLGRSEIRYRGLGSRLKVDLEGLSLHNPLFGFNDANSMFLFAAQELQSSAQSLSISLPHVENAFAKAIFGYGSMQSFKLGAVAGTPLGKYSSVYVASQFAATNGRFAFSSPDLKPGPANNFYRENNDQHRYQALIKFQHHAPATSAHVLAAFNIHEGGIPGFALSPTKTLRSKNLFAGLSAGFTKKINKAEFSLTLANSLFNHESSDAPLIKHEKFLNSTHELNFGIKNLGLPSWLDMELGQILIVERSYSQDHTRVGGGFYIKRDMRFKGKLKPQLNAYFNMLGYAKHGLLFKKDLSLSIEPSKNISISAGFTRSQRLPTFTELYANNRFLVGNEELSKESIWDFLVASNMRFGENTRLHVAGFWGYLSDLIVYQPFMGVKLRPQNIDRATRYGLDVALSYEPFNWLLVESKNSVLKTRVKATNAPLPQSPPFMGLTRLRLGPPDLIALNVQSRYRLASNANDYGSKTTKAYALFDALISAPIAQIITLSLSVTNIFNLKHARDTYEMPLPGTAFFAQIEVGNS